MTRTIAAINLKVQCADGAIHKGVTLAIEDDRKIYLASDGREIDGVERIDECLSVLPPVALAALLGRCREAEQ